MNAHVNTPHQSLIGLFFVVAASFAFSAKAIIIKVIYGYGLHITPIMLMSMRMVMSLPFFLIVILILENKQNQGLTTQDCAHIIGLGVIGFYLAAYLDFVGLSYISASLERLILLLYPTLVVLISAVMFRQPIKGREAIALLISYLGIIIVFAEELSLAGSNKLLGATFIFGSATAYAVYLIGSGVMTNRIGATRFTAYAMSIASITTLIHFSIDFDPAVMQLPLKVYALTFVMAIVCTVIPAFLMNAGIQHIGANPASIISSLGPVMTIFMAYMILGEQLTGIQVIGTALVMAGVFVISHKRRA